MSFAFELQIDGSLWNKCFKNTKLNYIRFIFDNSIKNCFNI